MASCSGDVKRRNIKDDLEMKISLYFACFILIFLNACSAIPALAPATPTLTSTLTFTPTFTPLPTETPTLTPTSTPDMSTTAVAQATETSDAVLAELDKIIKDGEVAYKDGHLAWKQVKPMKVTLSGPGGDYVEVDRDLTADNFILKTDVTWEASGIILCGVTFRSEPNIEKGKQYKLVYLRLSGLPAWEIEFFENGRFKNTPTKTQYSNAIDQSNGATNQLVLVAQDEQFTIYINRARQGRFFDYSKQSMDGNIAFRAEQDSGKGSCKFENSWLWALK